MKAHWRLGAVAAFLTWAGCWEHTLAAQEEAQAAAVLHIQQSQTTSKTNFPTYLTMYHVLDGAKSPAEALGLSGTISLDNYSSTFSEVLWVLVDWEGQCPAHDLSLARAHYLWSDILKNPSKSESSFSVNLYFPHPLPMTGCVGFLFGGGPLFDGKVTMSADLELTYQPVRSNPNTVVDLSGEYCFGQDWGCQNATANDKQGFAVPITMPAGHLVELFGNISDSTFDGTRNFGPLPTGESWGSLNDFYLLPGGCGAFGQNLNGQGYPNPVPIATLLSRLPRNARHLESVPMKHDACACGSANKAALQERVERVFPVPVKVNEGDCMLVIYGRTGNGATDNETQVHAVLTP